MYTWAEGEILVGEFVKDKYLHHGRLLEVPRAAAEWREMSSEAAGEEK